MKNRLLKFDSVFIKLFASVMLALFLFAFAMVILTHLVHDTSTNTRHQIIASQVAQQIEPLLIDLRQAQQRKQTLESRYLLALVRRSFSVYSESLNARFGLYDGKTGEAILIMSGLPTSLPPKSSWLSNIFPHNDPKVPTEVQVDSGSGFVVMYQSNASKKPPLSPTLNLITGTLLLLLIMSGMLWFIARTMTWRINQLSQQISQLGAGDFSVRVIPVGNDEITLLARGFNQTAERIERLMNANKLLLAHASHEIRTPITRIRLQIEMMSMMANQLSPQSQEKFQQRAEAINRDLTGLNDLVESILLVSRMDAGHAIEQLATVDLYELIKSEVQHYPQANLVGARVTIMGQAKLLTHLIRNLLDNAHLHGTPPVEVQLYAVDEQGTMVDLPIINPSLIDGEQPSASNKQPLRSQIDHVDDSHILPSDSNDEKPPTTLSLLKHKTALFARKKAEADPTLTLPPYQRVRIAVIDQGTGIPIEKREAIFSPFVRLQQEKKGSGLGLSLVAQIVAAHGGTIITDTLDGRTRFLVTLPTEPDQSHKHKSLSSVASDSTDPTA